MQQNINENLAYQTVRKYLMKVALMKVDWEKLVNSKNGQKNAPECKINKILV